MPNILMATVPLTGHVNPGLPIARKLIENGHDVLWYCGKRFKEKIESTGARFAQIEKALDYDEKDMETYFPGIKQAQGIQSQKFYIEHVFYDQMKGQYLDLKNILDKFPAQLVLSDPSFGGTIPLAEKNELPWVVFSTIPLILNSSDTAPFGLGLHPNASMLGKMRNGILNWLVPNVIFKDTQNHINKLREELELPPLKNFVLDQIYHACSLFFQCCTERVEYARSDLPKHIKFVGAFLPQAQKTIELPWLDRLTNEKPVIHVTQGTLDNADFHKLLIPTFRACEDLDVTLVATTGGQPIDAIDKSLVPANTILESFIPHTQLLPHVDIMITNGGYGGVLSAFANGVPMIVAGNSEEKVEVCARVSYTGAGINLKTANPSPAQIRKAIQTILNDPTYKQKAQLIQNDFQKHDAVSEMVAELEHFIATRTTTQTSPPIAS